MTKVLIELAIPSKCHHHLRNSERKIVTPIDLPEVNRLPVSLAHFFEVLPLDRSGHAGHEQVAAFHLELVGVPHGLLLVGQCQEELFGYDVLDPDETGIGFRAVVDSTLPHFLVLVLVAAEVVRLELSGHVVRVKVEPVEINRKKKLKGIDRRTVSL